MNKSNFGAGAALASIAGIFTLGGLISIGMLRKAVGTILIMLVGIYAISQIKGDFFSMIKEFSTRSEAADIRRLEFERERLKLEAETKLKVLEMETKRTDAERRAKEAERIRLEKQAQADLARQEADRVRQQKLAEESVKKEAEDKITKAKQSFVNGGFKLLDKNQFREVHHKLLPVKWANGAKVISVDALVNRYELTTASTGLKWFSERITVEVNCMSGSIQAVNSMITDGPWNTGDVLRTFSNQPTNITNPHEWHKSLGPKFCDA